MLAAARSQACSLGCRPTNTYLGVCAARPAAAAHPRSLQQHQQAARGSLAPGPLSLATPAAANPIATPAPGATHGRGSRVACAAAKWDGRITLATPCTLADALQQIQVVATPGSSPPPAALESLRRAESALGGRFYLVHCGEYADDHPLAGKPALGLLQMLLVAVRPDQSGGSPYRLKHMPVAVYAFQQPEDMESPMVYLVMYELGADGWPTGAAYNSATAFEKITTKKAGKKVLNTVRFLLDGFDAKSIGVFFTRELLPRDVAVVPKQLTPLLGLWSHDRLAAAGVEVMLKEDPISKRMRANMAEELAYQAAAAAREQGGAPGQAAAVEQGGAGQATWQQGGAAMQAPAAQPGTVQQAAAAVPPPSPPRTRVRRSRKAT